MWFYAVLHVKYLRRDRKKRKKDEEGMVYWHLKLISAKLSDNYGIFVGLPIYCDDYFDELIVGSIK